VASSVSEALLRALQTDDQCHASLPRADEESEINSGQFVLKGWIIGKDEREGLDRHDPWAGDISYPPIAPAPDIIDLMELVSDHERRIWMDRDERTVVLRSQLWEEFLSGEDDEPEKGSRLQASYGFLRNMVLKSNMDLIIEVQIRRRYRHTRYGARRSNDFGYIEPSTRFFLAKTDGTILTL
jgi:hypothetical protein